MAESKSEYSFAQFVTQLLVANGGWIVKSDQRVGDRRIDLILTSAGDARAFAEESVTLVEVKLATPQTSVRVRDLITQMRAIAGSYDEQRSRSGRVRLALAIPGVLTESYLAELREADIDVWDGRTLLGWAEERGLEDEARIHLAVNEDEGVQDIRRRLYRTSNNISSLDEIPAGREGWSAYQRSCRDILEHLFCPPLEYPYYESLTASRANKRDIIMANYAPDGFWSVMRSQYQAEFVAVDAKNLNGRVDKAGVLQIANYLSVGGLGLFGIIITRHGLDSSAEVTQREQWLLHRKLILPLTHIDIDQMIDAYLAIGSADSVLRQRIEEFRLSI